IGIRILIKPSDNISI
ncbi:jg25636, partial [Pararge aegeria aegeria]